MDHQAPGKGSRFRWLAMVLWLHVDQHLAYAGHLALELLLQVFGQVMHLGDGQFGIGEAVQYHVITPAARPNTEVVATPQFGYLRDQGHNLCA